MKKCEIERSKQLAEHLRRKKVDAGPNSLQELDVCDQLKRYIRNLQEKNVGNGTFLYETHCKLLQRIERTVKLELKHSLQTGLLTIAKFAFIFDKGKLTKKHPDNTDIAEPKTEDVVSVVILRVHHVDGGRTWEHTVFALVHAKKIHYFNFNDHGYYTKHMRNYFLDRLPSHNFIATISLSVLFPNHDVDASTPRITMQNGESL